MELRKLCGQSAVVGFTLLGIFLLAATLWFGRSLFLLVFAGVLLCTLLRAISNFLQKRIGMPYTAALIATVVVLVGAAVLTVVLIAPSVQKQTMDLWRGLPDTLAQARTTLQHRPWGQRVLALLPSQENVAGHADALAQRSLQTISGVFGVVGNLVVIGFVGLYLAMEPERYSRGLVQLFPPHLRPAIWQTMGSAGENLGRWLMGKLTLMVFVGIVTAVGLYFLHVPLLFPLALLAALLDFIPNIGPVASAVPAVLLALTIGPGHALWTIGLYLGVQVVESYILSPWIQGNAVSLPPAVLISAQVLFGVLLGLPGVLLATPITVVLLVFVRRLYVKDLLEQNT